jgi:hypothetical protein
MDNFVNLTNTEIADLISNAKFQVVYIAPAMEVNVANEIVEFVQKTSLDQVAVSLDLSTEVYREGFGNPAALDILLNSGIRLKDIPGLRLGMLLVDDKGWIYTPISKTTSPNSGSFRKNALFEKVNNNFLEGYIIMPIEPEQASLFDIGMGEDTTQTINEGESNETEEKIENIKKSIRIIGTVPPLLSVMR